MKIPTLWKFFLWFFSVAIIFSFFDLIKGASTPTMSVESVSILSFAITWALDRDKELGK